MRYTRPAGSGSSPFHPSKCETYAMSRLLATFSTLALLGMWGLLLIWAVATLGINQETPAQIAVLFNWSVDYFHEAWLPALLILAAVRLTSVIYFGLERVMEAGLLDHPVEWPARQPVSLGGSIGYASAISARLLGRASAIFLTQISPIWGELRRDVTVAAVLLVLWSFGWTLSRPYRLAQERGDQIELVLMNWSADGGSEEDRIVADLIARFQEQHPNIRVKRINPGDLASFNTKLQTMMAAGVTPDLFYMPSDRFAKFAAAGHLAPIEDLIEADIAAGRATVDLEDYFKNTVDTFRFDGELSGAGPLYGMPKDFTTWGFYYNKNLFDRAEIPYPADDWTWDDFHDAASAIGKLPGVLGGAEFTTWDDPIRCYLRTWGTDFVDEDFVPQVNDPVVREALGLIRKWRFEEDGTMVSGDSQVAQGQNIFVTGRVGLVGPIGRWAVPDFRRIEDFNWDFAPMPSGTERGNLVATVAWSIGSESPRKAEAWELVKYLVGAEAQRRVAELGLAVPTLKEVAYSDAFINPDVPPSRDRVYLTQAEYAAVPRVPGYPEWRENLSKRVEELLRSGANRTLDEILNDLDADWARDRANPLRRTDWPTLSWATVGLVVGTPLTLLLTIGGALWWRRRPGRLAFKEELSGLTFVSPWLIGFTCFMAFPIVMSLVLAFSKWSGFEPLASTQWVGTANFGHLLNNDPVFWTSLWVTAYYAMFAVPLGQLLALGAALLLNHSLTASGFFRSALYLPSVLAGVGIAILWRWVFDGEVGLMNTYLLDPFIQLFSSVGLDLEAPTWFTGDAKWFGPPAFAIMSFWAIGGTMVIYLAGLKGVPKELYEAAAIDGSTMLQRFRNITLPMLSPIIFFNSIMAIIGSFQVFTQAFVMTGGGPGDVTRFYVLYLYNLAFDRSHMGYASAMAWLLLVLILTLTLLVMRGSKRFVYYEALK